MICFLAVLLFLIYIVNTAASCAAAFYTWNIY